MIRLLLITWCLSALLGACAQTRSGIRNTYAYYKVSIPGNIPVDERGVPLERDDTVRVIYLECSGAAKPEVTTVEYPGRLYTASVFEEGQTVTVGDFTLKPAKGNRLWRVELTPSEEKKVPRTTKIIIKGARNGRAFSQAVAGETRLPSPIHM